MSLLLKYIAILSEKDRKMYFRCYSQERLKNFDLLQILVGIDRFNRVK